MSTRESLQSFTLLFSLLVQNCMLSFCIQISKTYNSDNSNDKYFSSTAVLLSEIFKIILPAIILIYEHESIIPLTDFLFSTNTWKKSGLLIFPAAVYTIQNNLQFIALTYISAAEFQLLSQLKTFTTAIFTVLFLGQRLSRIQWMSVSLLIAGVSIAQLSDHSIPVTLAPINGASTMTGKFYGAAVTILVCLLSGAAGVYQEMVLKKNISLNINFLNIQLALLSLFTNTISIAYQDGPQIMEKGFFFGYTPIVFIVVILSGTGGLLVAAVIRHTSNLAKSYAVSLSVFVSQLLSLYYFTDSAHNNTLTLEWTLAAFVVVVASLLYIEPNNAPLSADIKLEKIVSHTSGELKDKTDV